MTHNVPVTSLLELCADLPQEHVVAGDVLIIEGSRPERMLVLASGTITVEREGTPFARIDFPGAIFGEMSWILDKPATATARAATDVVVHVVSDPEVFFTERPERGARGPADDRLAARRPHAVPRRRQGAVPRQRGPRRMVGRILDTLVHHQAPRPRTGSRRDPEGDHDEH